MSKKSVAPTIETPVMFEPEFIAGLTHIFQEAIVFNTVLGLKIDSITPERVTAHIAMRPELVGHYSFNRIHGGVISAGLDAMGGLAVMAAIGARHMDYLRPGIGERFELRAEVMRLGSRVASTRMEFLGADGKLLSTGAGAYIVS
jgi:uncharacterized protein (TIGR00369 family)